MNISLAVLSEKPKLAVNFAAALAALSVLLTFMPPIFRRQLPNWLINATDFTSTILAALGVLYLLVGIQAWRGARGNNFDAPRETIKLGFGSVLVAFVLFGIEFGMTIVGLPNWLSDALGKFDVGLLGIGALYVAAGLLARHKQPVP